MEDKVKIFELDYKKNLNEIDLLTEESNSKFRIKFAKSLYVSFIDSISGYLFPKAQNRIRFTDTLLNFCDWPYWGYYSTPHLHRCFNLDNRLKSQTLDKYRDLAERLNYYMSLWNEFPERLPPYPENPIRYLERKVNPALSRLISVESDIHPANIEEKMSEFGEIVSQEDINILKKYQHVRMFYDYRNALLHDFLPPGFNSNCPEEPFDPYYEQLIYRDPETLEGYTFYNLVYPVTFFKKCSHKVLENSLLFFRSGNETLLKNFGREEVYWDAAKLRNVDLKEFWNFHRFND